MHRLAPLLSVLPCLALTAPLAQAQWSTANLSLARENIAPVTVGSLAIFAGGGGLARVDIYDDSSATWSTASLSTGRGALAGTVVGDLALFAGGRNSVSVPSDVVDILDTQTMTWTTATLSQARYFLAATTVGSKAIFAGGVKDTAGTLVSDVIDIYDLSLGLPSNPAAWSTATLSAARAILSAKTVGGQALFAGGFDGPNSPLDTIDLYDDASGLWSTAALSIARGAMGSATLGTRAYFGGGAYADVGPFSDRVDIYDVQSASWSTETLSEARASLAATAVGNTVLFAGGFNDSLVATDTVDLLHGPSGTWLTPAVLSQARNNLCATTVGGKALFAGGNKISGADSNRVDVYEPCSTLASASFRNAGSNPASYTCNAPVLGGTFSATVDLSTSGHSFARLVARTTATDITLAGGQHLLCGGTSLGSTPTVAGPLANFLIPVPTDLALCGLAAHTQALHLGGVAPFALSNAQDLVFGN